jgi:membrane protease subunit HflC
VKKLRWLLIIPLFLWLQSAFYTVDQTEFAAVNRLGEPIVTHDGGSDAGLHFKAPWPIDSVRRIDRRLQVFDLPSLESMTRDRETNQVDKTITVDAFVCWRIPDSASADKFLRKVGTIEQAQRLLSPRLTGRLAAVISSLPLDDLIKVRPPLEAEKQMLALKKQILEPNQANESSVPEALKEEYGIELVEMRIRRIGFPEAVRASIAERIRSERQSKVAAYQAEATIEYRRIVNEAERKAAETLTQAKAEKTKIEGQADAEADALRNKAHAQDPEFYSFLQKLAAYKAMLSETRDTLLISGNHELFDLLLNPPKPMR